MASRLKFLLITSSNTGTNPWKIRFSEFLGHSVLCQAFLGLLIVVVILAPLSARASIFSSLAPTAQAQSDVDTPDATLNSQKMPVFSASKIGPGVLLSDADSTTQDVPVAANALIPTMGPVGNAAAVDDSIDTTDVTTYTVHSGDTIASVASMFNLSKSTIINNNQLVPGQALKAGTILTILPTDGYLHTVAKGDTLKKIASKYKVDQNSIAFYNDIGLDDTLDIGDTLIVPDATFNPNPIVVNRSSTNPIRKIFEPIFTSSLPSLGSYLLRPLAVGVGHFVRGLHGARHSAVDIGAQIGTPILAAADGVVRVAMTSGYNTGYGKYVMIDHSYNGINFNTVYGHMSRVAVSPGQTVARGQVIGFVGSTGRSTGPHVHFEVNGAINPIGVDPNYGNY